MRPTLEVPLVLAPSSRARRVAALACLLPLVGCHGAPPDRFPTRGEIDRIATAPPPARVFDDKSLDVETWELRGPLPDALEIGVAAEASPWGKALAAAAGARPGLVVASSAMTCAAREVAAFVAEKKATPAEPLRRYMAARCGVPSTNLAVAYQSGDAPEAMSEAEIHGKWAPEVEQLVQRALGAGSKFVGIAFVRQGSRAVVAVASAAREAHLERTPFVPTEGKVVLKGELLVPGAKLEARINRGRFGVVECVQDINAAPPRFSIECPVAPEDASAWVQVVAFPPGRVLGDTVVEALVFPGGKPDRTYNHPKPSGAAGHGSAVGTLLERLNDVRKEAGLGPVRISPTQSHKAELLAPHYFAALSGGHDPLLADKIALGLQAGWDVEGLVLTGHFTTCVGDAGKPDELLEGAFSRPFGRAALLDPDVQSVAVGTVTHEGKTIGALFGTYALLDPTRMPAESAAMLARVTKLRRVKKLAPPAAVPDLTAVMAKAVERVEKGQSPEGAMEWLLERSAEQVRGMSVQVAMRTAVAVDRVEIPSELLSASTLSLAVGVGHHRAEGDPWAQLVVFFVTVREPASNHTASAPGPARGL
jgi:hypothetical protein